MKKAYRKKKNMTPEELDARVAKNKAEVVPRLDEERLAICKRADDIVESLLARLRAQGRKVTRKYETVDPFGDGNSYFLKNYPIAMLSTIDGVLCPVEIGVTDPRNNTENKIKFTFELIHGPKKVIAEGKNGFTQRKLDNLVQTCVQYMLLYKEQREKAQAKQAVRDQSEKFADDLNEKYYLNQKSGKGNPQSVKLNAEESYDSEVGKPLLVELYLKATLQTERAEELAKLIAGKVREWDDLCRIPDSDEIDKIWYMLRDSKEKEEFTLIKKAVEMLPSNVDRNAIEKIVKEQIQDAVQTD